MTFGEMQKWTERFNQILGGAQCLKQKRLKSLRADFIAANVGKKYDPYAGRFFIAITEEIEERVI